LTTGRSIIKKREEDTLWVRRLALVTSGAGLQRIVSEKTKKKKNKKKKKKKHKRKKGPTKMTRVGGKTVV